MNSPVQAVSCYLQAGRAAKVLARAISSSDVVETVNSETETWLKFRDETETLS